jgi:hypothetical protein
MEFNIMATVSVGSILSANLVSWQGEPQMSYSGQFNSSKIISGWRYQLDNSVTDPASTVIDSIFYSPNFNGFGSLYYQPNIFAYDPVTKIVMFGNRGGIATGGTTNTIGIGTLPALTSNQSNLYYTWDPASQIGQYILIAGIAAPLQIQSYNSVSATYTVNGNFSVVPTAGTQYVIVPSLSYATNSGDLLIIAKEYRMQRDFQWYRNNVAISGAVNTMYTAQPNDIGQSLTVTETSGRISFNNYAGDWEVSTHTTSNTSAPVLVTGNASSTLVYQDDITYLGSFALPNAAFDNAGSVGGSTGGFGGLIPAAYSQNGSKSLVIGVAQGTSVKEYSIPTPIVSSTFGALPVATLNRTLSDALGGNGAAGANGLDPFYSNSIVGYYDDSLGKSWITASSTYTFQQLAYLYRRPTSTANTGTVEGPVTVFDPIKKITSRANSGKFTAIPSTWQSLLGGDTIQSTYPMAIISNSSDGPAAIAFYKTDVSSAIANVEIGTARTGTSNTMQLSSSAVGSTLDYYKYWWVHAPSASSIALRISGYNQSTKTITVEGTFANSPTSTTTYKLIPYVSGNQLIRYGVGELDPNSGTLGYYSRIWNAATGIYGGVLWPTNTDSLIYIGAGGGDFYQYGQVGYPFLGTTDAGVPFVNRIYNIANHGVKGPFTGFSASGSGIRFFAYNAAELAQVKSGAIPISTIKPYGSWSIKPPVFSGEQIGWESYNLATAIYDPDTTRLYLVCSLKGLPSVWPSGVVHVYNVSIAPVITTTSINPANTGVAFTQTLSSLGRTPINWTVTAGSANLSTANLSLSTTGVLSGIPSSAVTGNVTFRATNSSGYNETTLTITVTTPTGPV